MRLLAPENAEALKFSKDEGNLARKFCKERNFEAQLQEK